MLNIGEFSRITGLTIKAIHLYHEQGLLVPRVVDERTGYRYFDQRNVEKARTIVYLKSVMFSLEEIQRLLQDYDDEKDIVDFLERKRSTIESHIRELKSVALSLNQIIQKEREAIAMLNSHEFEVEEKRLQPLLVASIRWKGKYTDTGAALGRLARMVGRHISGKPLNLYHDAEYKEDHADIESCFPIRKKIEHDDVVVQTLPGGTFMSLIHKGPYETLSRSYEKIFDHLAAKGYKPVFPSREIYVKGPGMILRGNPKNYLTEIQILVEQR